MTEKLFRDRPEDSSAHFFLLLVGLGLLAIGLILLLAGYGLKRTIHQQVYNEAQNDALLISRAILQFEADNLIQEFGPQLQQVEINPAVMGGFDNRMRRFLTTFEIDKIKIFDKNHRVVYSTDSAIIGLLDRDNPRLSRALVGLVDSSLKRQAALADLAQEARFDLDVVETYVPIFTEQGRVIGAIEIYKDVTRYRQTILGLIRKNISILALVLLLVFTPSLLVVRALTRRLSGVQAQLKEQASVDVLTGVLNRREILARAGAAGPHLRQELADQHQSNGIMMLDIDHFKQVNDTHGHMLGDLVLRAVAQRLATGLRQEDLVGRFGGEEFLLVLPGSSLETTFALGERIRKIIADAPFTCEGHQLSVTVSVGVSGYIRGDEQDFLAALEDADQGLYLAKYAGRDQVCYGPRAESELKFWGFGMDDTTVPILVSGPTATMFA
ncbi:GGDEF domain-containing protein [Desulfurivibrio sp. D14AmB]|uniref:GGDEF domain-containing protein n=1 Tax=Desulfurivibrio sp. D14AmB TaxID=3374370 RepID=UPI00376F394F